jgi:hypothetical protein
VPLETELSGEEKPARKGSFDSSLKNEIGQDFVELLIKYGMGTIRF